VGDAERTAISILGPGSEMLIHPADLDEAIAVLSLEWHEREETNNVKKVSRKRTSTVGPRSTTFPKSEWKYSLGKWQSRIYSRSDNGGSSVVKSVVQRTI
jgi:hypothetical protein